MLLSRLGSMAPIGGLLTNTVTPVVTTNMINLLAPSDVANTVAVRFTELTNDGTNIISCGTHTVNNATDRCGITVLDDNGDTVDNYFYTRGTTSVGFRSPVILANNGSWYGFSGIGGGSPTLIKFNGFNQITFAKRYSVFDSTGFGSMSNFYTAMDSNSNTYFVCTMTGTPFNRIIVLFKVDSSGNVLWTRELDTGIGGNDVDTPWFIRTDSSDNVYIVGRNNTSIRSSSFIKVSPTGIIQFAVGLDNPLTTNTVTFTDVVIVGSDFYVVGSDTDTDVKGIIAKYNSSGVLEWQKIINDVSIWEIKRNGSRIFYNGVGSGTYATTIVGEIDTNGTILWQNKVSAFTNNLTTQVSMNVGQFIPVDGEINMSSTSSITSNTTITTMVKVPDTGSIPGSGTYGFFSNQYAIKYQSAPLIQSSGSLTPLNITYTQRTPSVSVTDETGLWAVSSSTVTNYKKYI